MLSYDNIRQSLRKAITNPKNETRGQENRIFKDDPDLRGYQNKKKKKNLIPNLIGQECIDHL